MDPLTRYKMKLEKDKQHLQEYERIQKEKEHKNEMKLKQKFDKYEQIKSQKEKQKELNELKAQLRKNQQNKTLFQSQQIETQKTNVCMHFIQYYKSKIAKTLDSIDKYENGYHKSFLDSLHRKLSSHSHQVEYVVSQNEVLKETRKKQINQQLEDRFKKSEDVLTNLSKQESDRKKNEKIKVETYQELVQKHQEKMQELREIKAKKFDEKLQKAEQLQQQKEKQQKEKQLMRLEAERLKEQMNREFQLELARMKSKQIKLIQ